MEGRHLGETENGILVWRSLQSQDKPYALRAFHPTARATGTECCPVKIYKKFAHHRQLEMNKPDSPFYLAVKHQRKPDDDVWCVRSPLGKNEIRKFLSTAAKNASLQGRVTNHSVRKTGISRLLDANVSNNCCTIKWASKSKRPRRLQICLVRASMTNAPCAESLQQRSDYDLGSHRNHYSSRHFCYHR